MPAIACFLYKNFQILSLDSPHRERRRGGNCSFRYLNPSSFPDPVSLCNAHVASLDSFRHFSNILCIHAAVACTQDDSSFAVLACLPESSKLTESNVTTLPSEDGAILLFKVGDPVPVATWFVKKALGGGLAFLHTNPSALEEKISDENPVSVLLAYINGDHEYILFDPYVEQQACEQGMARRQNLSGFQETGQFGYASIYGELPEFDLKAGKQTLPAPFVASEKPWETIFSGSSHSLPPLTKLLMSSAVIQAIEEYKFQSVFKTIEGSQIFGGSVVAGGPLTFLLEF
ncbi:hypothetical protein TEA_002635 [Camellia sinensis var. sinensis]|uniref:Uncharacterized protein n=1 Tax=Camellia sinensis var. sinensis TaxID=542762 RepID=A0A4S4DFP6_CAMSN|nr:hypothetical protein TEA_002635 [Camellia sinensis var. sinensis]